MSTAMNLDLSSNEALILRTMWELKALGTRTVTIPSLSSRLSNATERETVETIKRLEARGLVTIRKGTGGDLLALSPLGAAFVRQLQDRQLGDLGRAS
jgi:DNA-binding MarR family transcriptional regulator